LGYRPCGAFACGGARQAGIASFSVLPIDPPEAEYVRVLRKIHRDPFDRLLIAQALLTSRTVITRDVMFAQYPGFRFSFRRICEDRAAHDASRRQHCNYQRRICNTDEQILFILSLFGGNPL